MAKIDGKKYVEDDEFSSGKSDVKARETKKSGPKRNSVKKNASKAPNGKTGTSKGSEKSSVSAIVRKKTNAEKNNGKFSTHGTAAIIIVIVFLFLAVATFSAFLSYQYLVDRYSNPVIIDELDITEENRIEFRVEKGANTEAIAEKLKEMGFIENKFVYKLMSKFNGYDGEYKSGVHYLREGLNIDEIMTVLTDEPETVKVTFPEGFTTLQIAERLDAANVCKKDDFLSALNTLDYSSYRFMPTEKGDMDYIVDGYLFPDTYLFELHSSVETVVYKMLNRFNDVFLPEYYTRLDKAGLTVQQAVIIASFVEKEAKVSSERETIARVYYNRLNSDDLKLMQCDATVLYFLRRNGENVTVITPEDVEKDDLYNTYVYEGLTPGAICSPSEASIKAVVTMNPHNFYYYVLKKDGGGVHVFSETLEEHKAAVAENKVDG